MKYNYVALPEDENENPLDETIFNDGRKVKNMVTINISIEMEYEKYITKRNKYSESLPNKVLKIFK